ncbi:MAG: hypothetical protein JW840_01840 [Candidatus Thermoplasmatota archaeon]|nr:hypothetical protein [Candidatus Thermoplasmatota archaeon]
MKKIVLVGIIIMLCLSVILSGCQDTNSVKTKQTPENVYLDSTIVEFANVTFDKEINKSGGIESVTVGWLFHNIAGRPINAKIDVKFYDENDLLLYNKTKTLNNIPTGYTEQLYKEANKVTYEGVDAASVNYVIISVTEI